MSPALWLLWLLTGGAIATWVMMVIWLPDPPPPGVLVGRFIGLLIVGAIGGAVGGYLVQSTLASSDHLPAIVGAASVGLIFSGGVALLAGLGAKAGASAKAAAGR